jgi:hypothetical protein
VRGFGRAGPARVAAGRGVAVQRGPMASADEGDASRLRIGGWVPESEVDPGDGSLGSAVTQLIPVVRDDDAPQVLGRRVGSEPVQRAVARRAPAPLPDLGRRDAPTEPRRRKAATGRTVADAPAEELPVALPDGAAALDRAVLPRALPTQVEPLDGDFREDAPTQADPTASAPGDVARRGKSRPEGSPGPAARPIPTGQPSPSPPPDPAAGPGPAARAGPTVLPADTCDHTDAKTGSTDEPYHGRRAAAPTGRLCALITLVLVGLGAAIAIPLATTSSPGGGDPRTLGVPTTSLAPDDHPLPGAEGSAAATASPAASVASRSPSPSASVRTRQARVADAPSQPPPPSPPPPPFTPATFEAEAESNELGGSARIWNGIVRNIGDWGLADNEGWLRFTNLTMPSAGSYTLTVYYTFINGEASRLAMITVNDADAFGMDFAGPAPCCDMSVQVAVTLQEGANTIHFANPDGHAPSIDKIVISGP